MPAVGVDGLVVSAPAPGYRCRQVCKCKEIPMRIPALAILTVAAISAAAPASAQTYDPRYPVCLKRISNFGGEVNECRYTSLEQCAQTASGLPAQCIVNPFYAGARDRRYRRDY
jgi:hypothetical protein